MKKLLLSTSLLILILLSGCAKEETRTYMFWWDFYTANNLQQDGITRLYFYVDLELVGTKPTSTYWAIEPNCGSGSAVEKTFTWTRKDPWNDGSSIIYEVQDQFGNLLAWDVIDFEGDCFAVQLAY